MFLCFFSLLPFWPSPLPLYTVQQSILKYLQRWFGRALLLLHCHVRPSPLFLFRASEHPAASKTMEISFHPASQERRKAEITAEFKYVAMRRGSGEETLLPQPLYSPHRRAALLCHALLGTAEWAAKEKHWMWSLSSTLAHSFCLKPHKCFRLMSHFPVKPSSRSRRKWKKVKSRLKSQFRTFICLFDASDEVSPVGSTAFELCILHS